MTRYLRLFWILAVGLLLVACTDPTPTPTPFPDETVTTETEATAEPTAAEPTEPPPTETPPAAAEPTATEVVVDDGDDDGNGETAVSQTDPQFPPAPITDPEGGPVSISGVVTYTNPFFTLGVASPVVILEDQAGFVDRNRGYVMPVESQALGQITTDFFTSPFSYSLALPLEPQGALRDVDADDETDTGVQVFAVAYWTNTFGDPFLEERDLHGGGWSTAYASTRTSSKADTEREVIGGKLLVYSPDNTQGFPASFGEDGLLFTEDDPMVTLPAGYTVVDLDTDPFTFDRSRHPRIDLIEPESTALVDYSDLSYTEAFDSLVDQLKNEYAFTEYKDIDWEALRDEFRPAFEEADETGDADLYRETLRDFTWSIPDGHISGPFLQDEFVQNVGGGIGLAVEELEDGGVIVTYVLEDSPAAEAGIEVGAELLEMDGQPIAQAVADTVAYTAPFSTEHVRRLNKLIFLTRFPVGTAVELTFQNPDEAPQTVELEAIFEQDSFFFALNDVIPTGFELPLEYELLEDSGYAYVQIYSFSDNEVLTVQLWERLMRNMKENEVNGLIIDMRRNGGGSGFLARQMAAYFFQESLDLGNVGYYDEDRGEFYFDPRTETDFILPPDDLRYDGEVAVIVGPDCASACEFFSYAMSLQDRATIIGHYPTAGLGGSIDRVSMPEDIDFTFTQGRAVNAEGEIHIEGTGVAPSIDVPLTAEAVLGEEDVLLDTAVAQLSGDLSGGVRDGGPIAIGDTVSGSLAGDERVRYTLSAGEGDTFNITVAGETASGEELDTVLNLYDEEENLLFSNDDAGEDTLSSAIQGIEIPFDLTLTVEVTTFEGSEGGAYTLSVSE